MVAMAAGLLAGCAQRVSTPPVPPAANLPAVQPPVSTPAPPAAPPAPGPRPAATAPLGPPVAARNWDEFKRRAAERMVAANPEGSYLGPVPEVLLAIPVIEIELDAAGNVRATRVVRRPTQALDTIQLAIDAIRRAAPYGDMTRLPRPWTFTEVFLFDDARRFKPRTLDD